MNKERIGHSRGVLCTLAHCCSLRDVCGEDPGAVQVGWSGDGANKRYIQILITEYSHLIFVCPPNMHPNPGARINSTPSQGLQFPPQNNFPPYIHSAIQLPMLGSSLQPNKGLQNPQQSPQQQQGPNPSEIPLPPQSGQDFTLSSVLHFLQTEWRRYERDRNEWEIERAEMRVRILNLFHSFLVAYSTLWSHALRLVLRCSRVNAGRLTMSSSILCVVLKCSSMP